MDHRARWASIALVVGVVASGCSDGDDASGSAGTAAATTAAETAPTTPGTTAAPTNPPATSAPATSAPATTTPPTTEPATTLPPASITPDDVVRDAVDATLAIEAFTLDLDARLVFGGQQIELVSAGAVDYAAVVADLMIELESGADRTEMQILADGETAWVRAEGGQVPEFPSGATWIAGDADQLESASSFDQTGLLGIVLVLAGAEDVEDEGTKELDGVEVHRYSFVTTYADAVAAADGQRLEFQRSLSLTGAGTEAELFVDVSLDADGVVRELVVEIDGGDLPVGGDYELRIDDVGEPVEPPAPPDPSDVATGPEADSIFQQMLA